MLEEEGMKSPRPTKQTALIHLAAGGAGGTAGAIVTCPLEVIKTRLQSSVPVFRQIACLPGNSSVSIPMDTYMKPAGLVACTRHIIRTEGIKSLFRGLGANLVGVAPARAIYFSVYANTKRTLNNSGMMRRDSSYVHFLSGLSAGIASSTTTSPIWVVKTRFQLDNRVDINRLRVLDCVQEIYAKDGFRGFYRGLSASYFGVSETVIHLVIYERIKATINQWGRASECYVQPGLRHFLEYMMAAGISKSIACTLTYPHEVVRTRLRQVEVDGQRRYRSFMQTLRKVAMEEGPRGLYGGLTTQLFRQFPNTGVIFLTYEVILSYFESV